jgi:hypothetical protein
LCAPEAWGDGNGMPFHPITWVRVGDRYPDRKDEPDSFLALDGETEIGAVAFVATGIDAGSWRWSLRHPHLGATSSPLAIGTMPTRKEAAQALLACWQAWYRTGDEGGEP